MPTNYGAWSGFTNAGNSFLAALTKSREAAMLRDKMAAEQAQKDRNFSLERDFKESQMARNAAQSARDAVQSAKDQAATDEIRRGLEPSGVTDAGLKLPFAGLPMVGQQGPSAPRELNRKELFDYTKLDLEGKSRAQEARLAAQAAAAGNRAGSINFQRENSLRDEYNQLSKPYQTVRTMFKNIESAANSQNPTAQSDMSLIFAYMKILDPNSTVREGEYATAANAGSVPDAVRNLFNKAVDGQKLQPGQRMGFFNEAKNVFANNQAMQRQNTERYRALANRGGVDPEMVVYDYDAQDKPTPGPLAPVVRPVQAPTPTAKIDWSKYSK